MLDPRLNNPNFDQDQRTLIYLFALVMCFLLTMHYVQQGIPTVLKILR